jgi:hypothetical protein
MGRVGGHRPQLGHTEPLGEEAPGVGWLSRQSSLRGPEAQDPQGPG